MLIVQKYGGSSLADAARLRAAAQRVVQLARQSNQVLVVVSAQADTTDRLLQYATAIHPQPPSRELDACLATGEQLCAALMAMTIMKLGHPAVSLTGWQAGLTTDRCYANANIKALASDRIRRELDGGNIVVVAGFQGIDDLGNITTLGRGGSDTTAVALAVFLQAELCQIFTDVDGVYDRDPRLFPQAVRYKRLSYDRMLQLVQQGAQVLHDRSVTMAKAHGLSLEVLSAFTGQSGTIIGP